MYAVKRHGTTRAPRLLVLLAGLLIWTSADGQRQAGRSPRRPAPPPVVAVARPKPTSPPTPVVLCLRTPAEPEAALQREE